MGRNGFDDEADDILFGAPLAVDSDDVLQGSSMEQGEYLQESDD